MKRRFLLALMPLAVLPGCQLSGNGLARTGAEAGRNGLARVERVVDGDTVILSRGLGSSRLVGVDTPETVKPGAAVRCFGPQASAFTSETLAAGRQVRFQVARDPVDPYGRSLVYIWLADGRFFNPMLVRLGYARPISIPPNTRYAPLFERLAERASAAGRGLWGRC